jgi:hypothetical protein
MRKLMQVLALATALTSVPMALATTSGAVTWHNSGDTAFTATGGGITSTVDGLALGCGHTATTGTVAASPFAGTTWAAMTVTTTYVGCLVYSGSTWACTRTFTATSATGGVISGTAATTCANTTSGVEVCHIAGTVPATYTNPTAPATTGRLTLPHTNALVMGNPSMGTCPMGDGVPVTMSAQTLTITSATGGPTPHLGPILTRTA